MSAERDPGENALTRRLDLAMAGSFAVIQRVLIAAVAVALVVLSVMALWDTVVLVRDELARHDVTRAITVGVDTVFLTVILLELLHTVIGQEPLARQAPDFIVIGITSAIRHGLSLVATSAGSDKVTRVIGGRPYTLTVPGGSSRDLVIDLMINSASVLLLVTALWLVRQSFARYRDEGGGEV
ncbi:MAG TPA: hypothetical protein VKX16_05170 [Chloroflexota bacterium]|nr:hypothetical protein [Chloroflexota bacterium]